jgi:hypothetical protein
VPPQTALLLPPLPLVLLLLLPCVTASLLEAEMRYSDTY